MKNGWGLLDGNYWTDMKWPSLFYSFVSPTESKADADEYESFELVDSITALLQPNKFENDDLWTLDDEDLIIEESPKLHQSRAIGRKRKSTIALGPNDENLDASESEPNESKKTCLMITCASCGDSFPFHEFTHCKTF